MRLEQNINAIKAQRLKDTSPTNESEKKTLIISRLLLSDTEIVPPS